MAEGGTGSGESGINISIPPGWEAKAMLADLIESGYCSYTDLVTDKLTIKDIFIMASMRDWIKYRDSKAYTLAKLQKG